MTKANTNTQTTAETILAESGASAAKALAMIGRIVPSIDADQDYDNERSVYTFADGSELEICGILQECLIRRDEITYYAADQDLSDSTDPAAGEFYRDWAKEKIQERYPAAAVIASGAASPRQVVTTAEHRREEIEDFCASLWAEFARDEG